MYLSNIKLWNFRKFGSLGEIDLEKPNLDLSFTSGVNVLIGENDSGKTAILEAIKMTLRTHAYERLIWEDDDFYDGSNEIRIELLIDGLTNTEAAHFTEWLIWDESESKRPLLRLISKVRRVNGKILSQDIKAGKDESGSPIDIQAREYLKVTFLKPLRDAENELTAKRYSRLSQILEGHELFKDGATGKDSFEGYVQTANDSIKGWFNDTTKTSAGKSNKEQIKDVIDGFLGNFVDPSSESSFTIAGPKIKEILEKLTLQLNGITRPGLGTMNRLYMAAELLHLQRTNWSGLKLCLVEEEEAHLHPQVQMKVLETIQQQTDTQFIITTHSPNLASKVKLYEDDKNQIVICKDGKVFPMGSAFTLLDKSDYGFLSHFLDVTKSNLFFAKGIILIEGWAEEILLPAIAKKMGKSLTKSEVSIINVGSTAYMRYAKIFMRKNKERMGCKVAIVTDLDIRPNDSDGLFDREREQAKKEEIIKQVDVTNYPDISWHIAEHWTLEWCLYQSAKLGGLFKQAVSEVHSKTEAFKKDKYGNFNEENFKTELINKLRKYKITSDKKHESVTPLNKVEVAYHLVQIIERTNVDLSNMDDDAAKYLVDAINFTC